MDQLPQDSFADPGGDEHALNRNQSRDSMFLMADFRIAGSQDVQHVRVRNLSAGGLMAELPNGLPEGLSVEFDIRGIGRVSGTVAWSAAGRVGVAFSQTIDPMLARKPVGQRARTPALVKPILRRR